MKALLIIATLAFSLNASADCKTALSASVSEFQSVLQNSDQQCIDATNATYPNDFAKKIAIASACPNEVVDLKNATQNKRDICEANCSADTPACATDIGLQTFYDLVEAM